MKIRFIKQSSLYFLQTKNWLGFWQTEKEKICNEGGRFYKLYHHKEKEALLNYVLITKYKIYGGVEVTEYPTLLRYAPFK